MTERLVIPRAQSLSSRSTPDRDGLYGQRHEELC